MISYDVFWKTLKDKGVSTYTLREKYKISSETLHRMKHNKSITMNKIDDFCQLLDCQVQDIVQCSFDKNK